MGGPPGRAESAGRRSLIGAVAGSGMHTVRVHAVRLEHDARSLVEHIRLDLGDAGIRYRGIG
jgi:hypothetical protein